jgi:hypothetical protein
MIRRDKSFFEVIAGASGSVVGDILTNSYPLVTKTADAVMGNGEFADINAADFVKTARTAGSLDLGARVYAAWAYGKHITNKGVEVDVDKFDAVLTALRLNPKSYQEAMLNQNVLADQKKHQEKFEKLAVESYRRATSAARDGDWDSNRSHMKDVSKWITMGDFGYTDRVRIRNRMIQELPGIEYNTERALNRRSPESLKIPRQEQFYRTNP